MGPANHESRGNADWCHLANTIDRLGGVSRCDMAVAVRCADPTNHTV